MRTRYVQKILYLARFAPLEPNARPTEDGDWGITPFYHHRLYEALRGTGLEIICSRDPNQLVEVGSDADFVYSIFNRGSFRNSEVLVASMCSYLGLSCLGGHPNSRIMAEDKHLFKTLMVRIGVPTPHWVKLDSWDQLDALDDLSPPVIVKQRFGADSSGISEEAIAYNHRYLKELARAAQKANQPVICEEFVPGVNLTIGAFGGGTCDVQDVVRIETDLKENLQTYAQKKFATGRKGRPKPEQS